MVKVKVFTKNGKAASYQVKSCETASSVKEEVERLSNINSDDFELVYKGNLLENEVKLSSISNLNDRSVLVMVPHCEPEATPIEVDIVKEETPVVATGIQMILNDRYQRPNLLRYISEPEVVQNLLSCVSGLKRDIAARSILRDIYLLLHMTKGDAYQKTFEKHPSLFEACQYLVAAMNSIFMEERPQQLVEAEDEPIDGADVLSMLPAQDNDDSRNQQLEAGPSSSRIRNGRRAGPTATNRQRITAEHVSAALSSAARESQSRSIALPGTSSSLRGSSRNIAGTQLPTAADTGSRRPVTTRMLREAVSRVIISTEVSQIGLARLHEMGFTDSQENLEALEACNGDIEAALDYIIAKREAAN